MTTPVDAPMRLRQVRALAPLEARTMHWQPLARTMPAGILVIALGSRAGVPVRLTLAGAAVAATTAFLFDDAAAVTLAASPTSLPARRLQRTLAVAIATALWWAGAAALAADRVGARPLRGLTLEFMTFVAIALAASATAARLGDGTGGGIAGAVLTLLCFATTLLPPWPWLPFPSQPDAPGAAARLMTILAVAVAVLAVSSRDPARRRTR
jgi:hypothetical protein